MTKRMLSLLLALVMTLSLCVPALAAGEFAEPVTEVEEQAPVAPVALEPEAEVEPAADEAVVAAITADVPVEAAVAMATEADYTALHKKLDEWEQYYLWAKDGNAIGGNYTIYMWLKGEPDTVLANFIEAYEAGQELYAEYEVSEYLTETHALVTETTQAIQDAGNNNIQAPVITNGDFIAGSGDCFNSAYSIISTVATDPTTYSSRLQAGWFEKVYDLYIDMKALNDKHEADGWPVKKTLDVLARAYKGSDAVAPALLGYGHGYKGSGSLASTSANANNCVAGKAVKATVADGEKLVAAYNKLVNAIDKASTYAGVQEELIETATYMANMVKDYALDFTKANQLKDHIMLVDVNGAVKECNTYADKLIPDTKSFKITSWFVNPSIQNRMYVFVEIPDGALDATHYFVRAQLNGSTRTIDCTLKAATFETQDPGIGTGYRFYAIIDKNAPLVEGSGANYNSTDVLYVELRDADGNVWDSETIEVDIDKDTTPQVIGAGFAKKDNSVTDLFYLTFNGYLRDFPKFTSHRIEITRPDGTTYKRAIGGSLQKSNNNVYWADEPVQVGTYTINYYGTSDKEYGPQTKTVTIANVTGTTAYATLQASIKATEGYEKKVATAASGMTTADAQAVVARDLADANKIVAAAATMPDTYANADKITKAADKLDASMKMLTAGADQSALVAAVNKAKALVKTDYTAESWEKVTAAVKTGEKVMKDNTRDTVTDRKAIADAAKAINDAIAALSPVKPTAELKALQALVDSVPAKLAADDYTAESKAAVNTALAEAQALLNSTTPTKSALQAAADKLEAALNALETAKGPQPPVGGTGWTEYNGVWYYFVNNVMKTNYWVTNGSNHNLWYHMGADGALDTGFQYIEDKTFGHGWYMLQGDNSNGMLGAMLVGWQDTKIAGMGWFVPDHNGNYGDCTWTKSWGNYYPIANTWDVGGSHITK